MSQFDSRSFFKEPLIFVNVNCHSVSSRYSFALVVYLQSIVNFKRHLECGWIMVKVGSSFVIIDDKVKGFYILCCGVCQCENCWRRYVTQPRADGSGTALSSSVCWLRSITTYICSWQTYFSMVYHPLRKPISREASICVCGLVLCWGCVPCFCL